MNEITSSNQDRINGYIDSKAYDNVQISVISRAIEANLPSGELPIVLDSEIQRLEDWALEGQFDDCPECG